MSSTATSGTSKRQKLISAEQQQSDHDLKESTTTSSANETRDNNNNNNGDGSKSDIGGEPNNFGVDVDDLTDDTDSDDDDELDDDDAGLNGSSSGQLGHQALGNHVDIQEQLAAAGPAGVAAAAAIATARKRKRPHSFETNPSVRKRQQTRLIRKLRACIDEYTMRVGQQAVVLITMPGKTVHNFKVFGAQPLESVIRACKGEIMAELEQALLEQAPQQFKDDSNKHELPPLVIDGIPTPVEKMTQAQLRAFIPLMLKYSTGRGKPGWGKESTRPPWWPETLPWANVRSDARDESEKQRISWTTTLRQIVTNCYKYHGRDDLLPIFDESEEAAAKQELADSQQAESSGQQRVARMMDQQNRMLQLGRAAGVTRAAREAAAAAAAASSQSSTIYTTAGSAGTTFEASNFVHTIANGDGTFSLIQVDPANAQILTLPDGTQVRAVRLQTLGGESICGPIGELQEATSAEISAALQQQQQSNAGQDHQQAGPDQHHHHIQQQDQHQHQHQNQSQSQNQSQNQHQHQHQLQHQHQQQQQQLQAIAVSEANLDANGQIIVTGEDGTQSCYPVSSLVSIPASMYQQFAQGGQQLQILTADGQTIPAEAISIHSIQQEDPASSNQQRQQVHQQPDDQQPNDHHQQQAGEIMVSIMKSDQSSSSTNNNNTQTEAKERND